MRGLIAISWIAIGFSVAYWPEDAWAYLGFLLSAAPIVSILLVAQSLETRAMWLAAKQPVVVASLFYFVITFAFHFLGDIVDHPFPVHELADIIGSRLGVLLFNSAQFALVMFLIVAIDVVRQSRSGDTGDLGRAYYPRLGGLRASVSCMAGRLILSLGFALLFCDYAAIALQRYAVLHRPHGWVYGSESVFFTCMAAWGLLWIADAFTRPKRETLLAAVVFLISTFFLVQEGAGIVE
jgi:hypothetical protein